MTERCPLSGGGMGRSIPGVCFEHCEGLWEQAVANPDVFGEYDIYKAPEDFSDWDGEGCRHEGTSLEHSHSALQALDGSNLRLYTIIDQCMRCEDEFGEQKFKFNCPNN